MKKNLTEVVFILDRSGSMQGLEKDVIGGFNTTINEQKNEKNKCIVSTVLFNDSSEVVHDRLPLEEIEKMTDKDYKAYGSTALIDALGDSIKYISKVHKILNKKDVPNRTLFVVMTDGYENSSHKYTSDEIKKTITAKQEEGWEFVYLAANIDAVETGKDYGFKESRSCNYVNDSKGNGLLFKATSKLMNCMCKLSDEELEESMEEGNIFDEVEEDYKKRNK